MLFCLLFFFFSFFFFKQKTAYEIYQCDWSSDVCSSDLEFFYNFYDGQNSLTYKAFLSDFVESLNKNKKYVFIFDNASYHKTDIKIGRASCRERV